MHAKMTMMSVTVARRTALTMTKPFQGSLGAVRNIQYSKQSSTPGITDKQRIENILPVSCFVTVERVTYSYPSESTQPLTFPNLPPFVAT